MTANDLERQLRQRFDVRTERFSHARFELELLLPRSSEELIDVSEFNLDERLPYWAELWPSARALAREIVDAVTLPDRALELGCGLGLPSLAFASRGGRATATDFYADAILFTRSNAERNRIEGVEVGDLDWREPPAGLPRFPLLLAADVFYESRNLEPLARAIGSLTSPEGEVWLADPGRVYLGPFLERVAAGGWTVSADRVREEPNPADPTRPFRIRLVRLVRAGQRPPPK